jgi:hypothetical protein
MAGARVSGNDAGSFGEEELRDLGFIPGGGTPFYSQRRSAAFILGVEGSAVDRVPRSAPPSCFLPEVDDDQTGKLGRADVGLVGGLRSGKSSSLFFSSVPFLFCLLVFWFLKF